MDIRQNDEIHHLIDNPIDMRCPLCATQSAMVPVSVPKFALIARYQLANVGIVCRCSSCNEPVFLKFPVLRIANPISLSNEYEQISWSIEPFEMKYLPDEVGADFTEALTSYATSCWNAFAAMSRRCLQSVSTDLGAGGTSKIQSQLSELKDMGVADDETFDQLHAIMLSGHDGAHPHLPALSSERAEVLLQVLKDVLYQLYVRPAKVREARELRRQAIESNAGES